MEKYVPDIYQKSIYSINYDKLINRGIKCILFDLDNTLVPVNIKEPNDKLKDLFRELKYKKLKIVIFSNSPKIRLKPFKEKLDVDCCASACKPSTKKFNKILEEYNYTVSEVAIIGDQIMTDILGGNKTGITTILVNPVSKKDLIITMFNRYRERKIIKQLRNHDLFTQGRYYE